MKYPIIPFLIIVLSNPTLSQISKTSIADKTEAIEYSPKYDSLNNFLGENVRQYIGQELYLIEKPDILREYGYKGFVLDPYYNNKINFTDNVYKCCDGYNSKYSELKESYFKVLDVIVNHNYEAGSVVFNFNKYFLKLEEKENKEIIYFKYDHEYSDSFPFLVLGFYEKQKELLIGSDFVFADKILKISSGQGHDIVTGKPLKIITGELWKCIDLTIETNFYSFSMIVENARGEKTSISYDVIFNKNKGKNGYTYEEVRQYEKIFGQENFINILAGQVLLGMTTEMCELSWGKPVDINRTITNGLASEQWVYDDNYLYFENGLLTAVQK